jgi:tetratricopeptide (TPR) repeat protein
MSDLGISYCLGGKPGYAGRLQEELLEIHRRRRGSSHPRAMAAMQNLANSYDLIGRPNDAMALRVEVLELCRQRFGADHPRTLSAMQNLAISRDAAGEREEALAMREEVLDKIRAVRGPEHLETLRAMNNLSISYDHAGRHEESLKLRESVLELSRKIRGPEHPETSRLMENLAGSYDRAGRRSEAMQLRGDAAEIRRKMLEKNAGQSLATMVEVAAACENAGRHGAARALRDEIARRAELELPGKPEREHDPVLFVRAESRARHGRWRDAADDCERLYELSPQSIRYLHRAALLLKAGDRAGYQELCTRALAAFGNSIHLLDAERVSKIAWLMPDLELDGEFVRSLSERALGLEGYSHSWAVLNKGLCELRSGDPALAVEVLERAVGSDLAPEGRATARAALAMARQRLGETEAARADLAAASEILGDTFAQPDDTPQQVPVGQWYDWLIARCVFEEAKALLK